MELKNKIVNPNIVYLKHNFIPKGLVPLERIFDKNYVPHKPVIHPKEEDMEEVSIGTECEAENIKLPKFLLEETKHRYIKLFK